MRAAEEAPSIILRAALETLKGSLKNDAYLFVKDVISEAAHNESLNN